MAGAAVFLGLKAPAFGGLDPFGAKKPPAVKCLKLLLESDISPCHYFLKTMSFPFRRVLQMTLTFYHPIKKHAMLS